MSDHPTPPPDQGAVVLYHYNPSLAGNGVIAALFTIAAIYHTWMVVRTRSWFFIPFVVGCLLEGAGYFARVVAADETPKWTLDTFVAQTLFLLLGPTLYAASIYMTLGRLIRETEATHLSLIRVSWLTKIFVLGDILSILAQGAGGGMLSKAKVPDDFDRANNVILLGLGIQIVFFSLFILTTVLFHFRIRRHPTPKSTVMTTPWVRFIWTLYACSVLILARSGFRLGEFALGNGNELQSRESYIFVFDGLLIFVVALLLAYTHPGNVMPSYNMRLNKGNLRSQVEIESDGFMMAEGDRTRAPPQHHV